MSVAHVYTHVCRHVRRDVCRDVCRDVYRAMGFGYHEEVRRGDTDDDTGTEDIEA